MRGFVACRLIEKGLVGMIILGGCDENEDGNGSRYWVSGMRRGIRLKSYV